MNKEQILKELEEIKQEAKKLELALEKLEEEKPQEKLHAVTDVFGSIRFKYKGNHLGHITDDGKCCILNTDDKVEAYNQWRDDGMHIDTDSVIEWRGGKYKFDDNFQFARIDIGCKAIYDIGYTAIYNFDYCNYLKYCKDDNIKRFNHNKRPIGY